MRDITDIFLPALPPSKKASNDGEIHILYEGGKSTLVLVVPNREEVYKVNKWRHSFFMKLCLKLITYSTFIL